jgi:hypothetical protein
LRKLLHIVPFFAIGSVQGQYYSVPDTVPLHAPGLPQERKETHALPDDSLLLAFLTSAVELQFTMPSFSKKEGKGDSLIRYIRNNSSVHGGITTAFSFGLLTGYIDPSSSDPLRVFQTKGDLALNAVGLPVNLSFNYSSFLNPLGVNNYIRVSLDTERLKQGALAKKNAARQELKDRASSFDSGKVALQGKLGMGEVLLQKYKRELGQYEQHMEKYSSVMDTTGSGMALPTDGLPTTALPGTEERDSLLKCYEKARERYSHALAIYDTLQRAYHSIQQVYTLYDEAQQRITSAQQLTDGLTIDGASQAGVSALNERKEKALSGLKTLDLGLTYPKTTGMTKNSVPVKGINLEYQKEQWYFTFCSGITMNNLMVSTDAVQNKLTNASNLFNQFDFQNIRERGWLTTVKSGIGTPETTHFFLGMRYLTNSLAIHGSNDSTLVPSLGSEMDIRYIPSFSKGTTLDLVYGKTSRSSLLNDTIRTAVFPSLFSVERTHLGMGSLTQEVKKLRTVVQGTIRWIDPYADVRSLGVLQPDHTRFEVKTTSHVSDGVRLGFNYRRDHNNLMRLKDTTAHLQVAGGQINGTLYKTISYFSSVSYLTQHVRTAKVTSVTHNYLFGLGLAFAYTLLGTKHTLTAGYNDYLITDTLSTGIFRSLTLQQASKLQFGTNRFSLSYFRMSDNSLTENTSYILNEELSVQRKKLKMTIGLKTGFSSRYGFQPGGKLELNYTISKHLEWTLSAEKMVLGDFYTYYSINRFERFPYAVITRIGWKF